MARERQRIATEENRGAMSKEEEGELKKVVTKGHWNLAKDKAAIHSGMEKVQKLWMPDYLKHLTNMTD